jgi:4-amino-4-deoxy-L-arabinose transferase-like glycosyltransferase
MSNPNTPATPRSAPRWFLGVALVALLAFGAYLATKTTTAAGGSDSSGYLNSARLLAAGKLQTSLRLPAEFQAPFATRPEHFTPLGFVTTTVPGHLAPSYPTGLPLHFAASARLFGWRVGPPLVIVGGALAALVLLYLVARELELSPALAAAGAVMLGAFPVFLFSSIQPLSDTPATTWCLAALYAALRARRTTGWALVCGAAFSIAVLVRPTNAVFAPALVLILGCNLPRLGAFLVAGLPAAAWFLLYNRHQYGGMFSSGYGNILAAFGLHYGAPTAVHFARWLAMLLPAAVLLLPFAALGHAATRTRLLAALLVGFGCIAGLYLFYEISREVWWCLRFILPAIPLLLVAALFGVEALARGPAVRWRNFRPLCALALGGWSVALSCYWSPRLHVFIVQHYEEVYAEAASAVPRELPANALVAASAFSGALYFYTDHAVLRSDMVEPEAFARYAAQARAAGRPICAVVFDFEEAQLRERCPGAWRKLATIRNVGLWQLE